MTEKQKKQYIPRNIHQVWVGDPLKRPKLTYEWAKQHEGWNYTLWDDERVRNEEWQNQHHIDHFYNFGQMHGVADVLRYEIIYKYGGIVVPADEEFVSTLDPLLAYERFTVYECDEIFPGRLTPIIGAQAGDSLLKKTIDELGKREMGEPWITSGNMFWTEMCEGEDIPILPSYTFLPEHYRGYQYQGNERIYGRQHFGTTHKKYGTL